MLYFEREKQVGIFANLSRNFCWFKWEFLLDFLGDEALDGVGVVGSFWEGAGT